MTTKPEPHSVVESGSSLNLGLVMFSLGVLLIAVGFAVIALSSLQFVLPKEPAYLIAGIVIFAGGVGLFGWAWKIYS